MLFACLCPNSTNAFLNRVNMVPIASSVKGGVTILATAPCTIPGNQPWIWRMDIGSRVEDGPWYVDILVIRLLKLLASIASALARFLKLSNWMGIA
jgi:hypothetical protein